MREVETTRRFKHTNILPVLATFPAGHDIWMVMPYVAGGAVSAILAQRHPDGLPEPAIGGVAAGVLRALAHLHRAGFMHRDIKVPF